MKNEMKPYKIYYLLLYYDINNTLQTFNEKSTLTQWYNIDNEPRNGDILFKNTKYPALVLFTERIYNKQEIREMKIKKLMK